MKKHLLALFFIAICYNGLCQNMVTITYANDSLFSYQCPTGSAPYYSEFTFAVDLKGYALTDTFFIKAKFGDGTSQSDYVSNINGLYQNGNHLSILSVFTHTYLTSGTYDVTYIAVAPDGKMDSVVHPAEVILTNSCSSLTPRIFVDKNSNCIYDSGDSLIHSLAITLYNGTAVYSSHYSSGDIALGVNYTAVLDPAAIFNLGYTLTCPVSGMINFTSSGANTLDFAVNCNANFDVSVSSSADKFKLQNSAFFQVAIADVSCIPKSGTYTLYLDPRMSLVNALNPPSSGGGTTYTWNYANLTPNTPIVNMMYCDFDASVQIGDTLCYTFSVTPVAGDVNPGNNNINICAPVFSAWDPNYKDVYPRGNGPEGNIPPNTRLTYTIGFQNTGNDTAQNVYILDTLDSNLDINSIQIAGSGSPMKLYMIEGNILRFNFSNILLPDSGTNQMASHGFITYQISPKANLATGTQIKNKAEIFFDNNPAVITNQTLNTIGEPASVVEVEARPFIMMPNPAKDFIKLQFTNNEPKIIKVQNLLGQDVISLFSEKEEVQIDLKNLLSGIYLISIKENSGIMTKKLIVE